MGHPKVAAAGPSASSFSFRINQDLNLLLKNSMRLMLSIFQDAVHKFTGLEKHELTFVQLLESFKLMKD